MSEKLRRMRGLAAAAAVAAALGWGGTTALAAPRDTAACFDPDAACMVSAQCIGYCFPYGGRCGSGGCCVCNR